MNKKAIEEQRKKIISKLVKIIKASDEINTEMQNISHSKKDIAYKSLKPKSGMYIVHSSNGFTAECNIDGKRYEIKIYQR